MRTIKWIGSLAAATCLLTSVASAQEGVRWQTDVEAAKRQAADTNRLVILHFWATWCGPCVRLDADVFSKPGVGQALEANYVPVKVRVDESAKTKALADKYGVEKLPSDVVIRPDGTKVTDFISPRTVEAYVGKMTYVAQSALPGRQQYAAQPAAGQDPYAAANAPTVPVNYGQQHYAASNGAAGYPPPNYGGADYNAVRQPQPDAIAPPLGAQAGVSPPPQYWPANNQRDERAAPPGGSYQQTGEYQAAAPYQAPALAQPAEATPPPSFRDQINNGYRAPAVPASTAGYSPATGVRAPGENASDSQGAYAVAASSVASADASLYGLDGYCPVHLAEQSSWIAGDSRLYAVHGGKTYFFAGEGCREKFLANPERYVPALGGLDPVAYLERGQGVQGKRQHGCFLGKDDKRRIVLFASEESFQAFANDPARYVTRMGAVNK